MRISPPVMLALAITGASCAGCSAGAAPPPRDARAVEQARALEDLRERARAQEERIRELEGRLALAQAEARDLREALVRTDEPSRVATVRIGPEAVAPVEPVEDPSWDEPEPEGPRPVLRLYGRPSVSAEPLVLPPPPAGVPDRLPIAPLPDSSGAVVAAPVGSPAADAQPPTAAGEPDPAEESYRVALRLVRDRRFDEAIAALDAILHQHVSHPRAADALYWRGVARYAGRRYERALVDFEGVLQRFGDSDRAPDAMLKMAMCHMRMGDSGRARALFRRVRQEFPNSVAARMASREDAS